jgi:hypothetical protein
MGAGVVSVKTFVCPHYGVPRRRAGGARQPRFLTCSMTSGEASFVRVR